MSCYKCPELLDVCVQQGLSPIVPDPSSSVATDQFVPPALLVASWANGSRILSSSIPTTWYDAEDGAAVIEDYGPAFETYVEAICE